MNIERFWLLLVQDCVQAYYAHPLAWDEIGFGGPAYPRAYMRLERGEPEPWEVKEKRYEWVAPIDTISDRYEPSGRVGRAAFLTSWTGRDALKSPLLGEFKSPKTEKKILGPHAAPRIENAPVQG